MRRLAMVALLLLVGCKPDSLRLSDEIDRVKSWEATIAAIDSARARNRVPARFADEAVADAKEEIAKSSKKIDELTRRGVKPKQ
jgi:hypothetical protein